MINSVGKVKEKEGCSMETSKTGINLIKQFEGKVAKYDSTYHWNQNQFDALASFAYNVGNIDHLTSNGTRSISVIAQKILSYDKVGGKVNPGLAQRRKAEHDLFLKPMQQNMQAASVE